MATGNYALQATKAQREGKLYPFPSLPKRVREFMATCAADPHGFACMGAGPGPRDCCCSSPLPERDLGFVPRWLNYFRRCDVWLY
jgi:hypothetical protein